MNQSEQSFLFQDIPLSPQLARAIQDMEYTSPTLIQAKAIPFLLEGQDVIGRSSTGTGKTAAFGIPAVECVDGDLKKAQVLVLSPTRELAMQIAREMQKYAKYKEGISVASVYGGASMPDQIRMLKKANIVIGTPGRVMDHLRRKTLRMDALKMVVLDEADEMLSMGFVEDIQTILSQAPDERQTVLFSATMPPPIIKISDEFLTNPQIVDVSPKQKTQATIEQTFYYIQHSKKQDALRVLLHSAANNRAIVFCNTKSMVDELNDKLNSFGLKSSALHGDMSQAMRTQVMHGFREGRSNVLIATDVAARGLDIDDVELVINFDLPQSFEYYIHRIGRTGRAGRQGYSKTLVCNGQQLSTLKALMRFTGSTIEEERLPSSSQMLEHAIGGLSASVAEVARKATGNAARQLVHHLQSQHGLSAEQIALALAEQLTADDPRFFCPADIQQERPGKAKDLPASSMATVTASIGRSSRVTPNHFIGALVEAIDISASSIGKIDIFTDSSSIGLRQDAAKALLEHNKKIRIAGQNVTFTLNGKLNAKKTDFAGKAKKDRNFRGKPKSRRRI